MDKEKKIKYLQMALAMQSIPVSKEACDRVIATYEKVLELGGKFTVDDAVEIEYAMDKKYAEEKIKKRPEKQ